LEGYTINTNKNMKNNATTNKNWNDYHIKIKSNQLFSIQLLEFNINKFWKEIVSSISDNSHILLLTRIKRINGQFVTIGKLQRLNKTDKDYLIEFLKDQIEIKSDSYINEQILQVTFSYGIKEGKIERTEINTDVKLQSHYKYKFPVSFDPLDYGTLIEQVDNKYWLQVNKVNSVVITCEDDINKVKLFKSGKLLFTWEDRKVDANTFIRTIDRNQYTFENNELKLTTISKPSKYITPLKEQNTINDKFLTLDIETTLNDENKHTPYAICFFDGVVTKSYYIADFYYNPELMFQACIKDLCIRKYKNYKVYVHNLARFDAIFLLKTLVNFANGVPVIHKGKIISIQINYNNIPIEFKDSYLLLLSS